MRKRTANGSGKRKRRFNTCSIKLRRTEYISSIIEKGYKIAQEGLTAIGDIKHGEFNLHLDFFNSLESINPAIKKYTKVADIITRELQITSLCKATLKNMKET